MKAKLKQRLLTFTALIIAVICIVEFDKYTKRQARACVNGVCVLPSEQAGAIVGPQNVPMLISSNSTSRAPLPRLIDFGAGTCATCKMMSAVLDEMAGEYDGRLAIQLIDTSTQKEITGKYSIRMIPTQIFLDADGNELFRHEGFISKEDILKKWTDLGVVL